MAGLSAGAAPVSRPLALGRLLRLSLAPSAAADIVAGVLLVAGEVVSIPRTLALMLASLGVYHGGMALNDWADREEDARGGRARPLPTGALAPSTALGVALLGLGLGPSLAWIVAPHAGLVLVVVAVLAALYDLVGRGPWRGPLLLAGCRAGNLGAGMALASETSGWRPVLFLAPLSYALYVGFVSRLARLEDLEPDPGRVVRPARWALASAASLVAIGALAAWMASRSHASASVASALWAQALTALAAFGILRRVQAEGERTWTPKAIQGTAGMALRRLLIATSALAASAGTASGLLVAMAILAGYPVSFALRRVFPPT